MLDHLADDELLLDVVYLQTFSILIFEIKTKLIKIA